MPHRDDDPLLGFTTAGEAHPAHAPAGLDQDRARGALLGLAVGDALGTTLEFSAPLGRPELPVLLGGPHTDVTGGGPFGLRPGQVTDDTQMAACLATSLMANGQLDAEDVARRYVQWMRHAFDVGSQTSAALRRFERGVPPLEAGRQVWVERNRQAAGNGSLMRTVPIALFSANLPHNRRLQSLIDSAITHFDPRCQLACAAFNAAVGAGASGGRSAEQLAQAARGELAPAAELLRQRHQTERSAIDSAEQDLQRDLDSAAEQNPQLCGPELHLLRQAGFVRVAFRLAFWHLLHTASFETALVDVVNRGGDADTNGAIAGALLGAAVGEQAIPARWRSAVLNALQDMPEAGPFGDLYHPRTLLRLISS